MHNDEIHINLRTFIEPPLRWWRFIVALVVLLVLAAGAYSFIPLLTPDVYEATAGVAIVRTRTEVSFESAAQILTEEDLMQEENTPVRNDDTRLMTLVSLVNSGGIAEHVIDELQQVLPPSDLRPGALNTRVSGQLAANGDSDLIMIVVRHRDPMLAQQIANAWGRAYEQLVNDVYARPLSIDLTLQSDVNRAKQVYDDAQEALIQSFSESRVNLSVREIDEKNRILDVLQNSRQRVISTTINQSVDRNTDLYLAYQAVQSANRLLAFEKEQERKRLLLNAYIDVQTEAHLSAFQSSADDRQNVLSMAYEQKTHVASLLLRARTLRDQALNGGDPATSALALTLLKAEAAGVLDSLANDTDGESDLVLENFSVQVPTDLVADTTAIVTALELRQQAISDTIVAQTDLLLNDEGLTLQQPVDESALSALIQERYPQLFEPGELTQLSAAILEDNALARSALLIAEDLLQLRNRQDLLSFSTEDTPLGDAITNLTQDIRLLEAQLERDRGRNVELVRARDLAFEIYSTLARKSAEIRVTDQLPGTEVRFASQAAVPLNPANRADRQVNVVLSAMLGLIAGIIGSFIFSFVGEHRLPSTMGGPYQAPWNRVLRWLLRPSDDDEQPPAASPATPPPRPTDTQP